MLVSGSLQSNAQNVPTPRVLEMRSGYLAWGEGLIVIIYYLLNQTEQHGCVYEMMKNVNSKPKLPQPTCVQMTSLPVDANQMLDDVTNFHPTIRMG